MATRLGGLLVVFFPRIEWLEQDTTAQQVIHDFQDSGDGL
jgi:hypothetical protein